MTETPKTTATSDAPATAATEATVAWLEAEFPGWAVEAARTATWEGTLKPLWIARRDGHHPQAEMTAAKLHTRLSEYLDREDRRRVLTN